MWDNEGVRVRDAPLCPLCGGTGSSLYAGLRDRYWDAPGTWSFRRCNACHHHLWLDPQPESGEIGKLYAAYFSHGGLPPLPFMGDGWWGRATRGVLEDFGYRGLARNKTERWLGTLARVVPPLRDECEQAVRSVRGPPHGELLDVGCGNGSYLDVMRALGWKVRGLEPDPIAAQIARDRGFEVIEQSIEEASIPDSSFDVVTMNHVIEHVSDPVRVLSLTRRMLKDAGQLTIVTPNVDSWGHRRFGDAWFHLDPPRHLHLFSLRNLMTSVERAGLRTVAFGTTGSGHLVYDGSVSVRTTGRFRVGDLTAIATARDRRFRVFESFLVRVRPDAGEEIYLTCVR
jgi:SAM-dependent methyltransferase